MNFGRFRILGCQGQAGERWIKAETAAERGVCSETPMRVYGVRSESPV